MFLKRYFWADRLGQLDENVPPRLTTTFVATLSVCVLIDFPLNSR